MNATKLANVAAPRRKSIGICRNSRPAAVAKIWVGESPFTSAVKCSAIRGALRIKIATKLRPVMSNTLRRSNGTFFFGASVSAARAAKASQPTK
ncbi:hypothetical protein D3C73_1092850 [compost metagenome]